MNKIKTLDEMKIIAEKLRKQGKSIVQCHGVFDLLHPGHIRHLKVAKEHGDVLVATVTKDKFVNKGPGRPVFNDALRVESLASLSATDFIIPLDFATAVEAIESIRPDYYVKGQDYKNHAKDVTGKIKDEEAAVQSGGGEVLYTDDIVFSSSSLINEHMDAYPEETLKYLKRMAKLYTPDQVVGALDSLKQLKVLVVGDAILDEYHYCRPMAKSSKEPIVVNQYISAETFAGGTLATANHTAQVSPKLNLLTLLGKQKSREEFIREHMDEVIKPHFIYRDDAMTTVKRRYVGHETKQKFFEVCYMNDTELSGKEEKRVIQFLNRRLESFDVVIVNDFGHGMITEGIIDVLCKGAKYLALNVQTNSANMGFNMVTKYPKADLVCIDELELRLAMHNRHGDLEDLVKEVYTKLSCQQVAVTRGHHGALCYSKKEDFDVSPALSYQVVDKVGAGDAFFAYVAPCFAKGLPQDLTALIGNAVGSMAVKIVGNREAVRADQVKKFVSRLLKF